MFLWVRITGALPAPKLSHSKVEPIALVKGQSPGSL